ncbi:MAG: YabP/YqfC family sporulation protein [Oscillospiraceae bacterium]|nr:YabP/YqfC family sporulation protein [Oscillospiraceae bacterium]
MKGRKHILDRMAVAADLSSEPVPKLPLVEIAGERRVLIENHFGVTGYGSQEICVKVRFGHVIICGKGLELVRMTKEQLVVMGTIDGVRFCKGGK